MNTRVSLCPPSAFPGQVEAYKATGTAELSPLQGVDARYAFEKLMAGVTLPEKTTAKPVLVHASNGKPYIAALVRQGTRAMVPLPSLEEHLPALHRPGYMGGMSRSIHLLSPESAAGNLMEGVASFRNAEKRSVLVLLGDAFVAELTYPAHLGKLVRW